MNVPSLRTVAELHAYMNEVNDDHDTDDNEVIWFACIREAEAVSDSFRLKDIASLFCDGIKKYDLDSVQNQLDIDYDCNEDDPDFAGKGIANAVHRFYGKPEPFDAC